MSKKKNNRTLLIVFVVLLAAVGINELVKSSKGERTFRKDIVEFEANDIQKITVFPRNAGKLGVDIYRSDSIWKLKIDDKEFAADQDMIGSIIDEIASMVPDRLIGNKKDLWSEYDITDSLGVPVMVYGPKKEKTEITLGRFTYNQVTRKPCTYVRVDNEPEVYAVEGYLAMTFNREINSLRDKNLYRGNQNDLSQISFQYPADSSFTLSKQDNIWSVNGMPVDSLRMAGYLAMVSYLVGSEFRDDFIPASVSEEPMKILLTGDNMRPVELKAYRDAKGTVLNSSENSPTYFSGEPSELFKRIFQGRGYFFAPKAPE